ncbi:MAG TPA: branched-chain amino acid ABC transporter permease [Acidimicrobiales bacterium]|jgi:branched-subunit amino acid ABC-type transport system permease component|nr:branched-chain amino acid ABC transporter permease [Acidimicrobiales bacterium]
MDSILVTLGFGLVTAAVLALSSVAFTLEYAVSKVPNLAHGGILTFGAYCAYLALHMTGSVAISAVAAAAGGAAIAWVMNFSVIQRFIAKGTNLLVIFIATLGLSFIIQNVLVMAFGAANVAYSIHQGAPHHVGPFLWTGTEEEIILSAVGIGALLYLIIQHTKFGKALRAVSQNRDLARVTGIRAPRVSALTWLLAGAVGGYAGFILAETVGTFNPYSGFSYLLITLTAAVAGGLGRAFGTMAGAVIVGIVLAYTGGYISSSYELAFSFAILALVVLFRPRGLFTKARRSAFE